MKRAKDVLAVPQQIDLLVALVGAVPWRDDREGMSMPLVSLAKGKRTEPIEWTSPDGERWSRVSANATYGMATIWDMDIIIWAVSQVNAAMEAGRPVSPVVQFQPHDMLRTIGRSTSGRGYWELEDALNRLAGTLVETNVRAAGKRQRAAFHLLEGWRHDVDPETERSTGMTLTLPAWLFEGVVQDCDVLAVSPAYFDITSGIARFLYRLARRHAGKQATGWRFTMTGLHERSGSAQPVKEFARGVRRVVQAQEVPEYRLDIIRGQRGAEVVSMLRDPSRLALPQRRDLARIEVPPPPRGLGDGHVGSPAAGHVGSPAKARGIIRQKRPKSPVP